MRTLTESEKRSINRRIRYLCAKQDPGPRSFRTRDRGYGPTGAVPREPGVILFLGFANRVKRGSGGFVHVGDVVQELFKQANGENEANRELLEVGTGK